MVERGNIPKDRHPSHVASDVESRNPSTADESGPNRRLLARLERRLDRVQLPDQLGEGHGFAFFRLRSGLCDFLGFPEF